MKEVKTPKKPLAIYYALVLLVLITVMPVRRGAGTVKRG